MPITARNNYRSQTLASATSATHLKKVWKDTIRQGLRRQPVTDLHDYMDVHLQIGEVAQQLENEIVSGVYRPRQAHIIPHEKRDGIARRLLVPTAADSLVLQALVEALTPKVLKRAPASEQSYYSRSHDGPSISDVDDTFAYPWWQLWGDFQKKIFKFAQDYPYLVVTDIANYYDTVPLSLLRNQIASMTDIDEAVLDLLFLLLESFVWRPDYSPSSDTGLPQLNFDAPRLLAHAFLFSADRFLSDETDGDFVRWMDDIDFGVKKPHKAKSILHDLQELVNATGLHLNTGKTQILPKRDAYKYFWLKQNQALTIIGNMIKQRTVRINSLRRAKKELRKRFEDFKKADRIGQWDKVYKRYFTNFGRLQDPYLQTYVPELLESTPSLRETIFKYYLRFGYSAERFAHIQEFLNQVVGREDTCIFMVARLFTQWNIPEGVADNAIRKLIETLSELEHSQMESVASLWLAAKYGTPYTLWSVIERTEAQWRCSNWGARQVAAVTPRLPLQNRREVEFTLGRYGLVEGTRVIQNLARLRSESNLDMRVKGYIEYKPKPPWPWNLERGLIGLTIMESAVSDKQKTILSKVITQNTADRVYKAWFT